MTLNNSLANPRLLCILAAIEARANDVEQLAGEPEQVASDRRKNATEAEKGKEGESEPPVLLGVAYTLASPSDPLDLGAPIITALERNCEAFTVAQELGQVSRRPDCLCKATNAMTERLQFVTNRRPWFCSCSSPRWFLPEVVVSMSPPQDKSGSVVGAHNLPYPACTLYHEFSQANLGRCYPVFWRAQALAGQAGPSSRVGVLAAQREHDYWERRPAVTTAA